MGYDRSAYQKGKVLTELVSGTKVSLLFMPATGESDGDATRCKEVGKRRKDTRRKTLAIKDCHERAFSFDGNSDIGAVMHQCRAI